MDAKGVVMHLVPAGEFIMGWNGEIRAYLDAFYMDKHEVTNALYKTCVDAGACISLQVASYEAYANYPVVYVDWNQAQVFCEWREASLPTAAQWEKAARGTDGRTYPWGDDFDGNNLNYCDRNCSAVWQDYSYDDGYAATAPVGSYESGQSPYGIYDMAGNVWEWVDDWDTDQYRVIRGGSWIDVNYAGKLHSAYGGRLTPNTTDSTVGFRCSKTLTGQSVVANIIYTPTPSATASNSTPLPTEITDTQGVTMHLVPEGGFTMGSSVANAYEICTLFQEHEIALSCSKDDYLHEAPTHDVGLSNYYMDVYEVSNAQYAACVTEGKCVPPLLLDSNMYSNYYGREYFTNYPMINVNWQMAETYCEWRGARLPTEAEWEKAAHGINQSTHPWNSYNASWDLFDPDFYINKANVYLGSINSGGQKDTIEVDKNPAGVSPYGMYNMAGNIAEWVADWYAADYYSESPSTNPQGPDSGTYKVVRGGSFYNYEIRTTARFFFDPADYEIYIGFRCAKDATP